MPTEQFTAIDRPFDATITPPGSKSLTNRALVLAALSRGSSRLINVLYADDTLVMIDCLRKLGFAIETQEKENTLSITGGNGRIPNASAELFCGNSGTTIRFLAALCALGKGEYILDGTPRMRQRPIGELLDLLRNLGVRGESILATGCPPVRIRADGLPGGIIPFASAKSSQFLSAALMISPFARHEVRVDLIGRQTSWPYVAMTMQLMSAFDVTPELIRDPATGDPKQIIIPRGYYKSRQLVIEPDASNATYFLAAAAIHPGSKITIPGLGRQSLQGDVGFADVLRQMGARIKVTADSVTLHGPDALEAIDVDLSSMPDTAQTLAVAALFAIGRTTIRGLHTLRDKETDRLAALSTELSRLGARTQIDSDTLHIDPPDNLTPAEIETYDDHRMAMSFALAATRNPNVIIKDAQCVSKTYPLFFADMKKVVGQTPAE